MKKTFLIILAVGFILFAFLGFKAAFNINNQKPLGQTPIAQEELVGKQMNLLIVHVDNVESKNARLLSAWGSLGLFSSTPQLMLVPLYPSSNQDITKKLESVFQMQGEGILTEKTISTFSDQYDLNFAGYLLVDNSAVNSFQSWTGIAAESAINSEDEPQETTGTFPGEKKILSNICKTFKKDGPRLFLNKIRWSDLIPGHFATNLSFEKLILAIDLFKTSGKISSCEVLAVP